MRVCLFHNLIIKITSPCWCWPFLRLVNFREKIIYIHKAGLHVVRVFIYLGVQRLTAQQPSSASWTTKKNVQVL